MNESMKSKYKHIKTVTFLSLLGILIIQLIILKVSISKVEATQQEIEDVLFDPNEIVGINTYFLEYKELVEYVRDRYGANTQIEMENNFLFCEISDKYKKRLNEVTGKDNDKFFTNRRERLIRKGPEECFISLIFKK